MSLTRRDAICASFKGAGAALAGLSVGVLTRENVSAQTAAAPWPDQLVERPLREGFPAPLPLNPDGSAPVRVRRILVTCPAPQPRNHPESAWRADRNCL